MVSGWYDVFFGGQMADWERLATRSSSRFVLGPWTHAGSTGKAFELKMLRRIVSVARDVAWLAHHLKGQPLMNPPGLYSFRMGENEWHFYEEWPGPTTAQIYKLNKLKSPVRWR